MGVAVDVCHHVGITAVDVCHHAGITIVDACHHVVITAVDVCHDVGIMAVDVRHHVDINNAVDGCTTRQRKNWRWLFQLFSLYSNSNCY